MLPWSQTPAVLVMLKASARNWRGILFRNESPVYCQIEIFATRRVQRICAQVAIRIKRLRRRATLSTPVRDSRLELFPRKGPGPTGTFLVRQLEKLSPISRCKKAWEKILSRTPRAVTPSE